MKSIAKFIVSFTISIAMMGAAWAQESEEEIQTPPLPQVPVEEKEQAVVTPPPTAVEPQPVPVTPVAAQPQPALQPQVLPSIEFRNAPLTAVLEYYARLTNRSIIAAPNLVGTINFVNQTPLTVEEAIQALDSVLAINGIATIPMGDKFLKVVQIATAKQEGMTVAIGMDARVLPAADTVITQIIPLRFTDPAEVQASLAPYIHPYGQLMPLQRSNSILITDTANNLNQLLEIIRYLDQPPAFRIETRIYHLKHARAAEVVGQLQSLIAETAQITGRPVTAPGATPTAPAPPRPRRVAAPAGAPATAEAQPVEESVVEGKVVLSHDERINAVIILSRPINFPFFEKIIGALDAKVEPDMQMRIVALQYADAEEMSGLLTSLITGVAQPTTTRRTTTPARPGQPQTAAPPPPPAPTPVALGAQAGEGATFLQFAGNVRILPDKRTNSILLMATREDLAQLEQLIYSMDTPVAQVLIEVVIAEVTLDDTMQHGIEVVKQAFTAGSGDATSRQGGGTRQGFTPPPFDISGPLATNIASIVAATAASSGGVTWFATFSKLGLDVALRLLATSNRFKVLSTPIIQTQHNQEGSIIVGESRPVITSTVSDVVAAGTTAVRSNIEFKDIAIELRVTPRINPDGFVTMDIMQTVNDVKEGGDIIVNGTPVPTVTRREAKSSVTVKDQSTIVLGGLIKENKSTSETKVPILGDIPFFGVPFKGSKITKNRTELIVFIRPTVLFNHEAAENAARQRGEQLKGFDEKQMEKMLTPSPPPRSGARSERDAAKQQTLAESVPAFRGSVELKTAP
jgi:general secretion pathway protein D